MSSVGAIVVGGAACGWHDDGLSEADTFFVSDDATAADTRVPPVDAETTPDSGLEVRWMPQKVDPILALLVAVPSTLQRFTARLEIAAERAQESIADVTRVGADGAEESLVTGLCQSDVRPCASLAAAAVEPGEALTVRLRTGSRERTQEVRVPTGSVFSHHAIAFGQTADGTIWTGTPRDGLVGVTPTGASVHYTGVDTAEPWDPHARGPQSGLVLAVEPAWGEVAPAIAPGHAAPSEPLWIGSATTGVSYFDPGRDPLGASDDLWIHGTPVTNAAGTAAELAETPTVIRAVRSGDGAWVGTVNGLFQVTRAGFELRWRHLVEGPVLALAEGEGGVVWVGSTTELAPEARVAGWSAVGGALIAVDSVDGVATAYLADTTAVLAILPRPSVAPGAADAEDAADEGNVTDDTLWLGTPRGLYRFHPASDAGLPVTERMNAAVGLREGLAVVQLAAGGNDAFWIAARSECVPDSGQLIRVALADDGEVAWATDFSDAGFGEHAFNVVRALPGGDVVVSTLVPRLTLFATDAFVSGDAPCSDVVTDGSATADTYVLTPTTGALARRLGE